MTRCVCALSILVLLPLVAKAATPAPRHGIDAAGLDPKVAPGDDFYLYANGAWERTAQIPPDREQWSTLSKVDELTLSRLHTLLEAARARPGADPIAKRVGDYYAALLDEGGIAAAGLKAVELELLRVSKISDRTALSAELGGGLRADVDPLNMSEFRTTRLFGLWVAPDLNAPEKNTAYLLQGGLCMPNRDYYLDPAPSMEALRSAYQTYIRSILAAAKYPDAEAAARRIYALEKKMAQVHWSRQDSGQVSKANNPWPAASFTKNAPGLDWPVYFAAAHLSNQPAFIVWQPSALKGLSALVESEPLEAWRDLLAFHALDRVAAYLPKTFFDASFAFYRHALQGLESPGDLWKRAVRSTSEDLADDVGQLYVRQYFSPKDKALAQALVRNIIAAFGERLDRLSWMGPATRARAKEKLSTLYVGVGYPDHFRSAEGLVLSRTDAAGNLLRAQELHHRQDLGKLGKKVDVTEWAMAAQSIDAVNLPLQNAINFPAGILQPPLFDPSAPTASNYGAIGAIIGHEISHSFDSDGALVDARGRLANWWTAADYEHFRASGDQLVAQYDAYRPFPDLAVNGKQTLAENIADLAWLVAALEGYQKAVNGSEPPKVAGFTGMQQFFLSYGQSARSRVREAALRQLLIADGHAPSHYRALTVRNLDPWYEAFAVKKGEKLYLAPSERVRIF